jgi:hypothetical protein
MAVRLSDLFQESSGAPIDWEGQSIHMLYELQPEADQEVQIRFEQPSPARPQALRLRARGGLMEVNGSRLDDVVLWSDSAPESLNVRFVKTKSKGPISVRVWNAWRDPAGTMQAWIGNAGMLVERGDDHATVLRCSDGFDEPSFTDLVAVLTPIPR